MSMPTLTTTSHATIDAYVRTPPEAGRQAFGVWSVEHSSAGVVVKFQLFTHEHGIEGVWIERDDSGRQHRYISNYQPGPVPEWVPRVDIEAMIALLARLAGRELS